MAKNPVSAIFLLIVIAWLMMNNIAEGTQPVSTITNRQSRHIFLFPQAMSAENALPSFDFDHSPYNLPINLLPAEGSFTNERSEPRIPNRFNRPVTSSSPSGDSSSPAQSRTFQAFANLFASRQLCPACPGCPSCPACPSNTCPVCPTCPPAPLPPSAVPATTIPLSSIAATDCLSAASLLTNNNKLIAPCSWVSAAPTGKIGVTFNAGQTVLIGIVAVSPNTQIKLTCSAVPTGAAKTQLGPITKDTEVNSSGFIQIIASASAPGELLTCGWVSS